MKGVFHYCGYSFAFIKGLCVISPSQVEVEVNGTPVELHMKIDETGRGFFSKRKESEVHH